MPRTCQRPLIRGVVWRPSVRSLCITTMFLIPPCGQWEKHISRGEVLLCASVGFGITPRRSSKMNESLNLLGPIPLSAALVYSVIASLTTGETGTPIVRNCSCLALEKYDLTDLYPPVLKLVASFFTDSAVRGSGGRFQWFFENGTMSTTVLPSCLWCWRHMLQLPIVSAHLPSFPRFATLHRLSPCYLL